VRLLSKQSMNAFPQIHAEISSLSNVNTPRCFACVCLRTRFDSVIVSSSCLESAKRSTASVFHDWKVYICVEGKITYINTALDI
jgi:hypothetical protein